MQKKDKKIWKYVVGKVKGCYGETNTATKTVKINKAYHKSKGNHGPAVKKNKNGSANILDTEVHELMHKNHPKMHERTVRKKTPKKIKRMSKKAKEKVYEKFKKR